MVIVDAQDRIIGALAGAPNDEEDFDAFIHDVEAVLNRTAPTVKVRKCAPCQSKAWENQCGRCRERRGDFKTLSIGISYGGGQTVSQHSYIARNLTVHTRVGTEQPGAAPWQRAGHFRAPKQ